MFKEMLPAFAEPAANRKQRACVSLMHPAQALVSLHTSLGFAGIDPVNARFIGV